ncbi:MAG: type II toxin-antitoxin system MqsA family antitoxin [Cyanobacteria bacterium TGS_CYA1]|nr:type II toxin-antitoxin system MqsA family antitoxin [Cyanobacteria bacterium TGS_CYA1]
MKCISCGKGKMLREIRNLSYTYKGQKTTIPKVGGEYCSNCNESLHNAEESNYLSSAMLSFNKEVNSASVKPEFIIETRKKLKLDQKEAAEIFGGGPNAFSRYENGKTRPPIALVQLFKLLHNHPELLTEIRESPKVPAKTRVAKSRLRRRALA